MRSSVGCCSLSAPAPLWSLKTVNSCTQSYGSPSGEFAPCISSTPKWLHAAFALSFLSLKLLSPRSVHHSVGDQIRVAKVEECRNTNKYLRPSADLVVVIDFEDHLVLITSYCPGWMLRTITVPSRHLCPVLRVRTHCTTDVCAKHISTGGSFHSHYQWGVEESHPWI